MLAFVAFDYCPQTFQRLVIDALTDQQAAAKNFVVAIARLPEY
jgi:hypothetical protein